MTKTPSLTAVLFTSVGVLIGCGASAPDDESSSPSTTASSGGDDTSLSALVESNDPYARAHADFVTSALADARRAAADAQNASCRADAEAHLDALSSHLAEDPTAAVHAVRAATELRIRLAACEAGSCAPEATGLSAHTSAALLLDLPAAASPADRAHPLVVGAAAADEQDWDAALAGYRQAADAVAGCAAARAEILGQLAGIQRRVDGPTTSRATLDEALSAVPAGTASRARGALLLDRGYSFAGERNYEAALAAYAEARQAYEELGDVGALYAADTLNATAVGLGELRRTAEAVAANEQVLAVRARLLGEAHPLSLISMSNIAVMAQAVGQTQKALETHQRILAIRERILEPNDPDLAVSLDAIGGILVRSGRAAEAVPICRRSVEIRESGHADARTDRPRSHVCLANALLGAGQGEQALREAATAVEQAREAQGRDHPDVAGYLLLQAHIAERIGNADLAAASRGEAEQIRAAQADH